ncbi:pyridoxamine 5'-phosphate oxidase family protein [Serinibacter salmoneus]|uniref:PPOX class probable F420-dependent enzyme n=1 Tax=Serinibacter salmoneus TaxID=556530 RepID=A0A2A9CYZ2_9MICO|nr:TIGR03618 family F420-dependent PPOX class oxidoreductase [Serinibacter salmoneus]PFG19225.1 PPOX class probable F420-dependent enzyme [Serinibacter salmoneus]
MRIDLTPDAEQLLADYHLATLTTIGPSGMLHAVAVGFTLHEGLVRIITREGSQKVRNIERDPRATVAQVAGPQWLSIAGSARIARDAETVALAVELYARRYRRPRPNPQRVAIEITPEKVLGSAGLFG